MAAGYVQQNTDYMKMAPLGGPDCIELLLRTKCIHSLGLHQTTLYTAVGLGEAASCGRGPHTATSQL